MSIGVRGRFDETELMVLVQTPPTFAFSAATGLFKRLKAKVRGWDIFATQM